MLLKDSSGEVVELFRPEAVAAKESCAVGEISLARSRHTELAAAVALFFCVMVVLLATFGSYTRRSTVAGELVPQGGLVTILAPATGVIAEVFVNEGDEISVGQAVAKIDMPRATKRFADFSKASSEEIATRLQSAASIGDSLLVQKRLQIAGSKLQLELVHEERGRILTEASIRAEQSSIASELLVRYRELSTQGIVSRHQADQQRAIVLDVEASRVALERQAIALDRRASELEQSIAEWEEQARSITASTARDVASLVQEGLEVELAGGRVVLAPGSGFVTNRFVEPGQAVEVGQRVIGVVPKGSDLQARLLVRSKDVGFIQPGDEVRLRIDAFPHQKFGHQTGVILRISSAPIDWADSDPVFQVIVRLDSQSVRTHSADRLLLPGMRVHAEIFGEKRRLYEWALEPLYARGGSDN